VALPDLQAAFGLTAAELSLLTAVYLWPFALMQPVAGLLTDALGPRRSVTIFLIIAGLGQLLLALAPNFALALTGRACTGIGTSILYVAAARIMAQWFRRREFGTLTGAWTSVANLGGIVAAAPPGGPPARDRLARELRRDRRRGAVRRPAGVPRRAQQPDGSWLARPHRP
jgi:MFS family permease